MIKKLTPVILLAFSTPLLSQEFYRGSAELLNEKAYSFQMDLNLSNTQSTFSDEAEEIELTEGLGYSMLNADFNLSYGINNKFQVSGLARLRKLESQMSEDNISSATGIESIGIEAKYQIYRAGKIKLALGANYRHALYSAPDEIVADELTLGDPGGEYGVNLYGTYNTYPFKLDGMIGYRSPGDELSDEIIYKAEGIYSFKTLAFFGGVEGIKSLNRAGENEGGTFNKAPINTGGVTKYFGSTNREVVSPYIGAHVAWENFIFSLKGQTVMAGRSTDKFNTFGLSVRWSNKGKTISEKMENSFKEYAVDGSVLKVSTRGNFIRIDQGLSTDVEKGMKFDIYQTDYFGGNVLVATGIVHNVGSDWSIIKLTKKHKDIIIKPGFAARGY